MLSAVVATGLSEAEGGSGCQGRGRGSGGGHSRGHWWPVAGMPVGFIVPTFIGCAKTIRPRRRSGATTRKRYRLCQSTLSETPKGEESAKMRRAALVVTSAVSTASSVALPANADTRDYVNSVCMSGTWTRYSMTGKVSGSATLAGRILTGGRKDEGRWTDPYAHVGEQGGTAPVTMVEIQLSLFPSGSGGIATSVGAGLSLGGPSPNGTVRTAMSGADRTGHYPGRSGSAWVSLNGSERQCFTAFTFLHGGAFQEAGALRVGSSRTDSPVLRKTLKPNEA